MQDLLRRIVVSTLLCALLWLVLPACTQSSHSVRQPRRSVPDGQVRRIKPLRFDALTSWLVRVNRQEYKLHGWCRMSGLGLTIVLHGDNHTPKCWRMAVEYTWAGPHRVIYPHQPRWAVDIVRDLHRVLAIPSAVRIMAIDGRYGQRAIVRQVNGDVTTYYFINNVTLPWRIRVVRPNGQRMVAAFRWTRQGRIAAIRLRDRSNKLRLNIKFVYRPES